MGRPPKQYLCSICRDKNPDNFYISRKSICKKCELTKIKNANVDPHIDSKFRKIINRHEAKIKEEYDEKITNIITHSNFLGTNIETIINHINTIVKHINDKESENNYS